MGAAYFIVLEKKDLGFDPFVSGKAVAREAERISKIARQLKLRDINDFTSFAGLAAEFDVDPSLESAQEKWFDPDEGLSWTRAFIAHISKHQQSVKNPARVLEDLQEYEAVLKRASDAKTRWHFEMDI